MRSRLEHLLKAILRPAIAVSGGVDSLTLAAVATEAVPDVAVVHAISPAVPSEATTRVRRIAAAHGWQLTVVQAGEFDDPAYRANPVNRCFYCKTNLYGTIRARTGRPILSGANMDDLGEYRPGLDAAREHGVRHPFIEAGIDKRTIRDIAHDLGLHDVAELPSSPCLSSRVETGIRIEPALLEFVHDVERLVIEELKPATVRCRVRAASVVVELDAPALAQLSEKDRQRIAMLIDSRAQRPARLPIAFQTYRNGSAFVGARP